MSVLEKARMAYARIKALRNDARRRMRRQAQDRDISDISDQSLPQGGGRQAGMWIPLTRTCPTHSARTPDELDRRASGVRRRVRKRPRPEA